MCNFLPAVKALRVAAEQDLDTVAGTLGHLGGVDSGDEPRGEAEGRTDAGRAARRLRRLYARRQTPVETRSVMELSPSTLGRLANSGLGAVPAVAGVAYAAQASTSFARLAACFAVVGFAVLAVRGYQLGVVCEHSRMVVRGYLCTRVISRERITGITDFPAVRWTAHTGGKRWTPITAFMTRGKTRST